MTDLEKQLKSIGESCKELGKSLERNSLQIENMRLREQISKKQAECEKFYSQLMETEKDAQSLISEKDCKINEMQSRIDCLQAELRDIQTQKVLPTEPIKVADMLIYASKEYETSSLARAFGAGEKSVCNVYDISDLRQIAEHLLVYCNNAECD